jgi:hypothetical protein
MISGFLTRVESASGDEFSIRKSDSPVERRAAAGCRLEMGQFFGHKFGTIIRTSISRA